MKFDIKRPCATCPFRTDVAPFLHRGPQLAEQLGDDHFWFACHYSTGMIHGKRVKKAEQSQCAGSTMVLWREARPNIAMRIALIAGMITPAQLEAEAPVFNSLEEFAAHHEGESLEAYRERPKKNKRPHPSRPRFR